MAFSEATLGSRVTEIALAPLKQPELIPSVLPLVLGAAVIELYFGKYKHEELGWNTSVGNAIIWVSTGVSLFMTERVLEGLEELAAGFLLASGLLIGYMNFFHKWDESWAFKASSAGIVYPMAYVTVVVVKTSVPVEELTLKAGAAFVSGSIIFFHIVHMFESPAQDDFAARFN